MADPTPVERLRLVATSIAGRAVEVAAVEPGALAWTDGRTVFLDPAAPGAEQLVALTVQCSLLAAGSLDASVMRRLARRPALTRGYLAVESARALAVNEERLPRAARAALGNRPVQSGSPEESLARSRHASAPADVLGTIRPRAVLAVVDSLSTAPDAPDGATTGRRGAGDGVDDGDGGPVEDAFAAFSDSSGAGGLLGHLFQRLLRGERGTGGGPLADAPTRGRVVAAAAGTLGRGRVGAAPVDVDDGESRGGRRYPEWDVRRGAYRPDWCTVTEEDPPALGSGSRPPTSAALRRALSQLGLGREPVRRRRQGEDLDVDAVVEAHVDRIAGGEPHDGVYVESLRTRHELAVLILLDISGSANEPGVAGRAVHDHQLGAAAALAETLHAFGNQVAVHGFYSQGRSAVRFVRVKRFADALDARAYARLAGLTAGAYTRLGAAIRHGASVLEDEGAGSRRLLVVLSDGFAYDQGYHGRHGEADARRALAEARRRGIGCLCLSVGATTDLAALRRVFGTAAHAAVRRPDDLGRMIGPLMRDALASADLQRRRTRRPERRAA